MAISACMTEISPCAAAASLCGCLSLSLAIANPPNTAVYVVYFKTSFKRVADYPNLLRYMRKCYAIPAVKECTNLRHIKMHYFTSHPDLNPYGIIPGHDGPALE